MAKKPLRRRTVPSRVGNRARLEERKNREKEVIEAALRPREVSPSKTLEMLIEMTGVTGEMRKGRPK